MRARTSHALAARRASLGSSVAGGAAPAILGCWLMPSYGRRALPASRASLWTRSSARPSSVVTSTNGFARPLSARERAGSASHSAVRRGIALPPITVVHGSDGYYVEDGRHRVSVARATGQREIDAWVR